MRVFVPKCFYFWMRRLLLVLDKNEFIFFRSLPLLLGGIRHHKVAFLRSSWALWSDRHRSRTRNLSVDRPIGSTLSWQRSSFWILTHYHRALSIRIPFKPVWRCVIHPILKHSDLWQHLFGLFHRLLLRLILLMSFGERCKSFLIRSMLCLIWDICKLI
jgi:hypothetical protein